jgi:hypothetical protein
MAFTAEKPLRTNCGPRHYFAAGGSKASSAFAGRRQDTFLLLTITSPWHKTEASFSRWPVFVFPLFLFSVLFSIVIPANVRGRGFRSHEGTFVVILLSRVVPHFLCSFFILLGSGTKQSLRGQGDWHRSTMLQREVLVLNGASPERFREPGGMEQRSSGLVSSKRNMAHSCSFFDLMTDNGLTMNRYQISCPKPDCPDVLPLLEYRDLPGYS